MYVCTYVRFVLVEELGPARHEAGLPGEPEDDEEHEDDQHSALSEAHAAQLLVLVLHHVVRRPALSFAFHLPHPNDFFKLKLCWCSNLPCCYMFLTTPR